MASIGRLHPDSLARLPCAEIIAKHAEEHIRATKGTATVAKKRFYRGKHTKLAYKKCAMYVCIAPLTDDDICIYRTQYAGLSICRVHGGLQVELCSSVAFFCRPPCPQLNEFSRKDTVILYVVSFCFLCTLKCIHMKKKMSCART